MKLCTFNSFGRPFNHKASFTIFFHDNKLFFNDRGSQCLMKINLPTDNRVISSEHKSYEILSNVQIPNKI